MSNLRFAFDLGTTSVGWAVIEYSGETITGIKDAGVRIFEEPRDERLQSLAVERRRARGQRRQIRRRAARRRLMIAAFKEFGWLPSSIEPPYGFTNNPYRLRVDALDRPLSGSELAEVFFHLAKRRGFKSNRKSATEASESTELAKQAQELQAEINKSGSRTLGEYLHKVQSANALVRLRGRRTLRSMYLQEFDLITKSQFELNHPLVTEDRIQKLRGILTYQLPFELQQERRERLIAKCKLLPDQRVCYRWDPEFQTFRIEKTLSDLKIVDPLTGSARPLTPRERSLARELLLWHKSVTFPKLRKALGLHDGEKFNFELDEESALKGDPVRAAIGEVLGAEFKAMGEPEQVALIRDLAAAESEEDVRQVFRSRPRLIAGRPADWENKIATVPFPDGTGGYSLAAIGRLAPLLKEGKSEWEAIEQLFGRVEEPQVERLPIPKDLRNPTVNRAMSQFRRVFNALIAKYGKPDSIAIELARDFAMSAEERKEMDQGMRRKAKEREKLAAEIRESGNEATQDRILRMELHAQQGHVCPYTGKTISMSALMDDGQIEVDHILPFSRSLDDSKSNLVVCFASANREKGNLTPAEWLEGRPEEFSQMLDRVARMKFSYGKRKRFFSGAKAEPEECIARQLNDTRYISRAAREYSGLIFKPTERHVGKLMIGRGGLTAWLRHLWGIKKDRNDLRHHAMDAIVIGCTTPAILRSFQTAHKGHKKAFSFPAPFPGFRERAEHLHSLMVVSHQLRQKIQGALHDQTNLSPGHLAEDSSGMIIASKRIELKEGFTETQLENVKDPIIREILEKRLESCGWQRGNKASLTKAIKGGAFVGLKMASGVPIRRVGIKEKVGDGSSILLKDKRTGKAYRRVCTNSNFSLSLIEVEGARRKRGSSKPTMVAKVLSVYEASNGGSVSQALITLKKGDIVQVDGTLGRVRALSTTPSGGPYVNIDTLWFGGKTSDLKTSDIGKLFWRITSASKLLELVRPAQVDCLGGQSR
jgi:CRISPR-associated endonuclease Csn1